MSSNSPPMSNSDFEISPEVNPHLVEHLQRVFPNKLPANILTISDRELGVLVGQQKIIDYLTITLEQQIEKD